jgi:hypothetical protein
MCSQVAKSKPRVEEVTDMSKQMKLDLGHPTVNQAWFDRLPALLSPYQATLVTGMDRRALVVAAQAGKLEVYERPVQPGRRRSYRKYTKASVGKLVGFQT